jgi:hypothetical protein
LRWWEPSQTTEATARPEPEFGQSVEHERNIAEKHVEPQPPPRDGDGGVERRQQTILKHSRRELHWRDRAHETFDFDLLHAWCPFHHDEAAFAAVRNHALSPPRVIVVAERPDLHDVAEDWPAWPDAAGVGED